jgi:hypothetical protein
MKNSKLYAASADVEILKHEPDYAQIRYYTIIKTILVASFRWTRQQAADFVVDRDIGHPPVSNTLGDNLGGVTSGARLDKLQALRQIRGC